MITICVYFDARVYFWYYLKNFVNFKKMQWAFQSLCFCITPHRYWWMNIKKICLTPFACALKMWPLHFQQIISRTSNTYSREYCHNVESGRLATKLETIERSPQNASNWFMISVRGTCDKFSRNDAFVAKHSFFKSRLSLAHLVSDKTFEGHFLPRKIAAIKAQELWKRWCDVWFLLIFQLTDWPSKTRRSIKSNQKPMKTKD